MSAKTVEDREKKKDSIKTNVAIIAILTIVLGVVVVVSDGGSTYFKWGPDDNLHFISFTIDDWTKYIGVMIGIIPLAWMDVYSYDKVQPYFEPRIFYDNAPVSDWKKEEKWQLAFWAELSYGATNFRNLLDTLISVTNFYFAIWRWLLKEILCVYFINVNLNEKENLWDDSDGSYSELQEGAGDANELLTYRKPPSMEYKHTNIRW